MIVGTFIKALPAWVMWLALAALVSAAAGWGWVKGAASVQQDWNTERATQTFAVLRVEVKQAETTERVVTQYVDRDRIVRTAADTVIREVPTYVKERCDPDGLLPAGFRWVHDAGACNGRCLAEGARDPDGAAPAEPGGDPR